MGYSIEHKRLLVARSRCPDLHAAKDTAKRHDLTDDDVAYQAFMWLWAARGRFRTLERMIAKPTNSQKAVPREVASYLWEAENRDFLNRMMSEANGLHEMYKSR